MSLFLYTGLYLIGNLCGTGNEAKRTRGPVLEGDWLDHEATVPPVAAGRTDANIKSCKDECTATASGH